MHCSRRCFESIEIVRVGEEAENWNAIEALLLLRKA
jgi:hypothetical protein